MHDLGKIIAHLAAELALSRHCLVEIAAAEQEHGRRNSEQRSTGIAAADLPGEPARQRHKQDAQNPFGIPPNEAQAAGSVPPLVFLSGIGQTLTCAGSGSFTTAVIRLGI